MRCGRCDDAGYGESMHFTKPRELLVAGVLGLAVGFTLFQTAYGALPRIPVLAGISLLVLAVVEFLLGFAIRKRISEARVALSGVGIARAMVLAKASSVLGSLMLGVWLGMLGALVPDAARVAAAQHDLTSSLVGIGSAVPLIAAALWLEYCCRDPYSDQRRRGEQDERSR